MRIICGFFLICFQFVYADPLPSWNEGSAKRAILEFVNDVTDETSPHYIASAFRIATFDQDGTLWVEKPMYTQFLFAMDRLKILAKDNPAILDEFPKSLKGLTRKEIEMVVEKTHAGMTVNKFHELVLNWLKNSVHPRFKRPFTELVYQPMLEVIQLFQQKGFTTYIVSGGGQEFMRAYADNVYHIPKNQVIGTVGKVKYVYQNDEPALIKLPEILFVDDQQGKPEAINLFIGKRPVAAFGNSDGDRQMLEWTESKEHKWLAILVHHDDALREYAYGKNSEVGTFSASLMEEAIHHGWLVVSMKNDWKIIFPWQKE